MNQEGLDTSIKLNTVWMLFVLALALLLQNSWVEGMFFDGHLYAAFGKNAVEKGAWLVPHLMDSAYGEFSQHPPFIFILEGLFFKVFGIHEVTARIFVSLFALLTMFFVLKKTEKNESKVMALFAITFFILIPPLLKKSRFPNMDIPLMMFTFGALYHYYRGQLKHKYKDWIACGLFWGGALLTKGAMGMLVPAGIGFHILFSKGWKNLLKPGFWVAFTLGLLTFSLWPLSLKLSGKYFIFEEYLGYVFGLGKGEYATGFHSPFYTYPLFLIKQTPHILIPFLYGLYRWLKKKEASNFIVFSYASFLGMLTLLSLSSVKLSNYLLSLYPFYAICAAFGAYPLLEKHLSKFRKFITGLALLAPLVLLIFPLTNTSKRDQGLYQSLEVLKSSKIETKISKWYVVDNVYPFWNVANWVGWKGQGNVWAIDQNKFKEMLVSSEENQAWLIPIGYFDSLENKKSFQKLYESKKENILILIKKSLIQDKALVERR
ncbi:MAG: glycosyltransferase family 39 protein [Deltaproteobacteria bacterium]|nr:MAG: glycosyltransferase family 39 protein [Deltaproteobacteria bacterium]